MTKPVCLITVARRDANRACLLRKALQCLDLSWLAGKNSLCVPLLLYPPPCTLTWWPLTKPFQSVLWLWLTEMLIIAAHYLANTSRCGTTQPMLYRENKLIVTVTKELAMRRQNLISNKTRTRSYLADPCEQRWDSKHQWWFPDTILQRQI